MQATIELVNRTAKAVMSAALEPDGAGAASGNLVDGVLNPQTGALAECGAGTYRLTGTFHDGEAFVSSEAFSIGGAACVEISGGDGGIVSVSVKSALKADGTPAWAKAVGDAVKGK